MNGPEVLVPILSVVATAWVLITFFTSRNRERMAMIEKGLSSDEIKALYARDVKRDPLQSLKWGILFVLAGIALMLGNYLHDAYAVDGGVVVGMVILFVGIGLVAFYTIASKRMSQ
ncbi:MAG TPA: DUF6249 domain-containing protein [Bacteroidota bacterium]|jgi:hypothetical protein|nr:DUF6249 domain-containing protein [Bacteroidota bacterium]